MNQRGKEKKSVITDGEKPAPFFFSARFSLAVVSFFGFVNLYLLRFNMSVAIVCMVNNTAVREISGVAADKDINVSASYGQCPAAVDTKKDSLDSMGSFIWEKQVQGVILSSFFWGYLLTQLPGGWLATQFGGKRVYGYSMLMTSILALLTPVAAKHSYKSLIAVRFGQGLGEGVVFPAMHAFWGRWAPPFERSKLIAFTIAGSQVGDILVFPLSGLLCHSLGWSSVFYFMGSLGVVWFVLWMFFAYDSPRQHPRISAEELEYIEKSLKGEVREDPAVPWRSLLTSLPVWTIVINHCALGWGFYTLVVNLPTFMREILRFDIKSNGLYSALPWIACALAINVSGILADELRRRQILSTKNVRRLVNAIGVYLPATFLVIGGYLGCGQRSIFIALLVVGQGLFGFAYSSTFPSMVDIAPRYGGIVFGISNTFTTITGIVTPYVVTSLTTKQTQKEWQVVFWISFAIQVTGCTFYNIFISGDVQDWAKDEKNGAAKSTPTISASDEVAGVVKGQSNLAFSSSPQLVIHETGL